MGGRGRQPSRRHGNLPAQRRTPGGRRAWRAAARRLADRIGDLGGAITADPRQLVDRAPGDTEFTIPDCSDPQAIISYALHRLDVIITAYQAFLDTVRGRDDVSFALVVGLLAAEAHRRADVMAALAGQRAAV